MQNEPAIVRIILPFKLHSITGFNCDMFILEVALSWMTIAFRIIIWGVKGGARS